VTRQSDVSAALLQATPAVGILPELTCVSEACALIAGKLGDLANALAERRPLTPRLVGAVLGISGQERARWTKDGRLRFDSDLLR
jgi:hypothetical protein